MVRTVKDLKAALNKFDEDMPVVIRRCVEKGGISDWTIHAPEEMYPGGKVCIMAFEQFEEKNCTVQPHQLGGVKE